MVKTESQVFLHVEVPRLEKAAYMMRAIAHPLRLKIISFIDKHKTINVNKIYNALNLEQSITSQHLKILRHAELVKTKREGKFIHYAVNYDAIVRINHLIEKYKMK